MFSIIGTIVSSFIPETINANLPQTLEDAEKFAVNYKYFQWESKLVKKPQEQRNSVLANDESVHRRKESAESRTTAV